MRVRATSFPGSSASDDHPATARLIQLRPSQQLTLQERANKEAARRADTEARFADAWRQLQAERDALAAARVRSCFQLLGGLLLSHVLFRLKAAAGGACDALAAARVRTGCPAAHDPLL